MVTECLEDIGLSLGGIFDNTHGFSVFCMPTNAGMQLVHMIHGAGCRQGDFSAFQVDFDKAQIGESDHAGEDVFNYDFGIINDEIFGRVLSTSRGVE